MQISRERIRQLLRDFEFETLFIEELGWDRHTQRLNVTVDETEYLLTAIAHKRGMVVFLCAVTPDGTVPDSQIRRKIQREVTRSVHEHLIIFTDADKTTQIWQRVIKRQSGRSSAPHEHRYHRGQSGEGLIQKLRTIVFSLDEEENLTLTDVVRRVDAAFNVERVTKQFYDRFKEEHTGFLEFLEGIPDQGMESWYASVMLNRLMFIYFIQKKGFLNDDMNYLRTKLGQSQANSNDRYYTDFLCPLFFEGFAKPECERNVEAQQLLGKVPYLNGGIFQRHQIEELHGERIQIANVAFEKLFSFFEMYHWHLDERPFKDDNEVDPEVLGYIFEKYINQEQMGAYYTQEDITEYISKNTIIPFLFDAARKGCRIAFEGEASIWQLLQADPDRYIYDAIKTGVGLDLPAEITAGIDDVSKRGLWNEPAPDKYANPTEIWREVIARRNRYETVRAKLSNGEIGDINALITYNLDIHQFAQDVIKNCEDSKLLDALWEAITQVKILDPTCGSGAFLFAALNILEPLYDACLDRMEVFLDELEHSPGRSDLRSRIPERFRDFRKVLEDIEQHPNRRYFILKSIIVNNLYGVDIMEEAIEICKLRLFLKMVAQIDDVRQIEPLPDIDFNIQAGNTLVGYATYDEVKKAIIGKLDFDNTINRIKESAEDIEHLFEQFRLQQTELDGAVTSDDKQVLQDKLKVLEDELNRYLAEECDIDPNEESAYQNWLSSHKPFHWFIEFYGILKDGGFDVIIGNPPYLELNQVNYTPDTNLTSYQTGAIHAMCMDGSLKLLNRQGCMSMIVPLALVSTQRMQIIQSLLEKKHNVWYSNYSWRPGKLFDTVNRALTIFIANPSTQGQTFSTNYQKWTSNNRDLLMYGIDYVEIPRHRTAVWAPKLGMEIENALLEKCLTINTVLQLFMARSRHQVYHRTTGGLYWKVFTDFPPAFRINGRLGHSTRETSFGVVTSEILRPVIAALSSDLFWWWYTITTNCRDLNPYDIQNFPIPESALYDAQLARLGEMYLEDLQHNSTMLVRRQRQTGRTETQSFKIQKSKPIIDEIDRVLAQHYSFTDEELDFIINYDIKYRMGLGSE